MHDNSSEENWDQAAEWQRIAGNDHGEPPSADWILGRFGLHPATPDSRSEQPESAAANHDNIDAERRDGEPREPVMRDDQGADALSGPSERTPGPRAQRWRGTAARALVAAGTLVVVGAAIGLVATNVPLEQSGVAPQAGGPIEGSAPPVTDPVTPVELLPTDATGPTGPGTPAEDRGTAPGTAGNTPGRSAGSGPSVEPGGGGGRRTEPQAATRPVAGASPPVRPAPAPSRVVASPREPTYVAPSREPTYVAPRAGITVRLVSYASGKSAGVSGGSGADGARVVQSGSAGSNVQHWRVLAGRSGCYHLINVRTGKALDNTDGTSVNGKQMQQWTYYNGSINQLWCFTGLGGSRYSIKSMSSGFLLDIRDGGTADGVAVQQWNADPANPNVNQTWRLIQVS